MTTANQFQHRLDAIQLPDAAGQEEIAGLQNELRQLLEDINREMQVIRGQYNPRIAAANAGALNRQGSPRHRADEVERLETERDQKIQPFVEVREKVEALLARVDEKASGAKS